MKTVFSHSDLAHQFAHQLSEIARTPNNSMFIADNTIWSYGRHFAIAKHATNDRGQTAVLFTTRSYSNTTAKHIRHVQHACNHLLTIDCNDPSESPRMNFEAMLKEMKGCLLGLDKAKKPEKYIEPAKYILHRANIYAEFMGVSVPAELTSLIESVETGEYKVYLAGESERIATAKKEREEREIAEGKKQLAQWRKFKGESRLYNRLNDRDHLRIGERVGGNRETKRYVSCIQTSQGVEIPTEAAKRAYKWIVQTIKAGGCNGNCEYKVLDFKVTAVTPELITIGCHKLEMNEINAIAKKLKW